MAKQGSICWKIFHNDETMYSILIVTSESESDNNIPYNDIKNEVSTDRKDISDKLILQLQICLSLLNFH